MFSQSILPQQSRAAINGDSMPPVRVRGPAQKWEISRQAGSLRRERSFRSPSCFLFDYFLVFGKEYIKIFQLFCK